jgi:DNA repair exonuclease SbcCD nuclease subunit
VAFTEVIFIPDLHLNAFSNLFPELDDSNVLVYEACQQPIKYARYHGIKNLIVLGDVFDDPDPDQNAICAWQTFFNSLQDFNTYLIPGNHDYSNNGQISLRVNDFINSNYKVSNSRLFMKPTEIKIDGVPFCFFPWPHYKKSKFGFEGPSVNIAHIEIAGMLRDNGNLIKEGIKLNTKQDYWVIGHLHQYQKSKNNRVVYPGTLFQKTFGEKLPKGFLHSKFWYKNGVLKVKHKWVAMQPPFELINLRIEKPEDLKLILPQVNTRPILRYKLFIKKNTVALPPNFLHANPHVIKHRDWLTEADLEASQSDNFALDSIPPMEVHDVIFRDLSHLLKTYGLNKEQRIKAKHIVQGYVKDLLK